MREDFIAFIAACPECDRENPPFEKSIVQSMPAAAPCERIHFDCKPLLKDSDSAYLITCVDSAFGITLLVPCQAKDAAAWITAMKQWRACYGPFQVAVTDDDSVVTSHAVMDFAAASGFVIRRSSDYHKSNALPEIVHKFINAMLRKLGGDQARILHLIPDINYALNSRCRFKCAGMYFNVYGLMRGNPAISMSERAAGAKPNLDFDFSDWLVNAAIVRQDYARQVLKKRGEKFSDDAIVVPDYPDRMPPGTLVWVSSEALPNDTAGTSKTKAKATGPFKILDWKASRMTALLEDTRDPTKRITRNVEFIRQVRSNDPDLRGPDEFVVKAIIGERRKPGKGKTMQYLIDWEGYAPDHWKFVDSKDIYAKNFIEDWKKLPVAERKEITKRSLATKKEHGNLNQAIPQKDPEFTIAARRSARSRANAKEKVQFGDS